MDLISIVMPVKNALPYLEECLQSIINQTYTNWELIAVDDSSTDNSYSLLIETQKQDSRIKVFKNNDIGIIPALQTAYSKTKGNFITRMDADDIMPNYKLELMLKELKIHSPNTLVTGYVEYFSATGVQDGFRKYQDWLNSLVDNQSHHKEIYKECVIPSPCWMTTRKAFDKVGGFDNDIYPEDYDLTFRFYLNDIKTVGIPELLHHWRDHSTRTSRTHVHYAVNSFLSLKVYYFLKLNHNPDKQLVIWGAGRKGKEIANLLTKNNIKFEWICNNPHKVGVEYKGTIWQDCNSYFNPDKEYQIIGSVSKPSDQELIKSQISKLPEAESFWFC